VGGAKKGNGNREPRNGRGQNVEFSGYGPPVDGGRPVSVLAGRLSERPRPEAGAAGCESGRLGRNPPVRRRRGSRFNCQRAMPVYRISRNRLKRAGLCHLFRPLKMTAIGGCHPAKAILRLGARPVAPWAGATQQGNIELGTPPVAP
jgi:hypothetical protein